MSIGAFGEVVPILTLELADFTQDKEWVEAIWKAHQKKRSSGMPFPRTRYRCFQPSQTLQNRVCFNVAESRLRASLGGLRRRMNYNLGHGLSYIRVNESMQERRLDLKAKGV